MTSPYVVTGSKVNCRGKWYDTGRIFSLNYTENGCTLYFVYLSDLDNKTKKTSTFLHFVINK